MLILLIFDMLDINTDESSININFNVSCTAAAESALAFNYTNITELITAVL